MDKIDTHAWKIKGPLYTVYSYDKRVYIKTYHYSDNIPTLPKL